MGKNILLTIEYDGSVFHGWQRQPGIATVQGHLEETLSSLLREEVTLNGTSRTDAGVHALGQRASFVTESGIPAERIAPAANNMLRGREKGSFAMSPVRILSSEEVPAGFHARFDAKGKRYVYRIRNAASIDVFSRNYVYHVDRPLDTAAMAKAAVYLQGTHDFKSFEASGGTSRETTVRTIYDIKVAACDGKNRGEGLTGKTAGAFETAGAAGASGDDGFAGDIEISVSGDGFLYNMVRIITGTLVDAGLGKIDPDGMKDMIEARDRSAAGHTAPPYGLYLAEIYY